MSSDTKVSIESVLIEIGFELYEGMLQYNFVNCILYAELAVNRNLQLGYSFSGRSLYYYHCYLDINPNIKDFFIPMYVKSYKQGVALLSYYLQSAYLDEAPN